MNRAYVVAAFRTNGDSPSKGARITELLLVRIDGIGAEVARLQHPHHDTAPSDLPALTPQLLDGLVDFVGTAPVVTHDGYNWKRFLRQEFASQPKDQVKGFLALTIDVSEWSQQRFPKQRKNVEALCERLQIELPSGLAGLAREAAALRQIVPHLEKALRQPNQPAPTTAKVRPNPVPAKRLLLPFRLRLKRAWEVLFGTDR